MQKTNYGIDAPGVIRNFLIAAVVLTVIGLFVPQVNIAGVVLPLGTMLSITAAIFFVEAAMMVLYARYGKFRHRDRMLALYKWKGNEQVLDIGTGLGLLMIGSAKKLSTGKSTGIDIWNAQDLSNNTMQRTALNVAAEQVSEKVEILSRNILETGFNDEHFDVILSNLCLHNIYDKAQRETACKEIYRILKTGGVAIISDFRHSQEYHKTFENLGMEVQKTGTYYLDTFPPLTIIRARKK